jgi:sugar O-acyltransferase (sialic acid O-acetyltransferase NeuD family)
MKLKTQKKDFERTRKIFLFGAGLHGQTCIDVIEKQAKYEIAGLIDSEKKIGSLVDGYKVLGRMQDLPNLISKHKVKTGFIGIGDNWVRKRVYEDILSLEPDFEFVNIIHPSAVFGKNVSLGKGILIGAETFISSSCSLGDFCLLHHQVLLGLQNHLSDFSSVSLGSLTGGKVTIGEYTAITLRAVVKDRINIGSHSVIGSGSLVLKNIPDFVVVYGHPAEIIRSRKAGEKYLESS